MKQIKIIFILIISTMYIGAGIIYSVFAQEAEPPKQKKSFSFFHRNPEREIYQEERKKLRERHLQEQKEANEQYAKDLKQAEERYEQEKKQAIEKQKQEKEEAIVKEKIEKSIQENVDKSKSQETLKNKDLAKNVLKEREKEIKKVKKLKRTVDVITNEGDPLFITDARVLNAKTSFLKIKDVELKYKLTVHNQTPKIISSALILWERKIPFGDSQRILKETKVSKPIIPYEKRVIEYNDLDSTRQGEVYKVKIANIIFEDGTQWKNPL